MDNLNQKAARIFDGLNRNDTLKFTTSMFQQPSLSYTDPQTGESREMSQQELNEYVTKSPIIYSEFMSPEAIARQQQALQTAQSNIYSATNEAIGDMYEEEQSLPKAGKRESSNSSEYVQLMPNGMIQHTKHHTYEKAEMSRNIYTVAEFQAWLVGQEAAAEAVAEAMGE